ncbi:MAG: MerR family transcriptional regulator [Hespellia sp.]|nr:MerR family transcriptional regulator [Hespellia sp.]
MKKSISEMAKMSGVSVRTLHYYDEINLLKPSEVISETGYRYYDEDSLVKLQQILFYRELDFSLKEIMKMMKASDYNKEEAFIRQRELLKLKRKRLDQLIGLLDANLEGVNTMSFQEFDTTEIEEAKEKYAKEVKDRWGTTDAYTQSQKKTAGYGKDDWKKVTEQMDELLKEFAQHLGESPQCEEVQVLVGQWQQHITDTYYDCTKEVLAGLGQMYVADERFTKNMDKFGAGTAKLISDAIAVYCN